MNADNGSLVHYILIWYGTPTCIAAGCCWKNDPSSSPERNGLCFFFPFLGWVQSSSAGTSSRTHDDSLHLPLPLTMFSIKEEWRQQECCRRQECCPRRLFSFQLSKAVQCNGWISVAPWVELLLEGHVASNCICLEEVSSSFVFNAQSTFLQGKRCSALFKQSWPSLVKVWWMVGLSGVGVWAWVSREQEWWRAGTWCAPIGPLHYEI